MTSLPVAKQAIPKFQSEMTSFAVFPYYRPTIFGHFRWAWRHFRLLEHVMLTFYEDIRPFPLFPFYRQTISSQFWSLPVVMMSLLVAKTWYTNVWCRRDVISVGSILLLIIPGHFWCLWRKFLFNFNWEVNHSWLFRQLIPTDFIQIIL